MNSRLLTLLGFCLLTFILVMVLGVAVAHPSGPPARQACLAGSIILVQVLKTRAFIALAKEG